MRKLLGILMLLAAPILTLAQSSQGPTPQYGGNITGASSSCVVPACVEVDLPSGAGSLAITITGTWSATLQLEYSADNQKTWTTLTTVSGNGLTTTSAAALTNFRVRASAYTSGNAGVFFNASTAVLGGVTSLNTLTGAITLGAGTGITITPSGNTLTIASTVSNGLAIPTNGLLADYQLTEGSGTSVGDSSGNGNTATFCAGGQAPTWNSSPNVGLSFSGGQCVALPTAVNGAKTWFFFVDDTSLASQFSGLVVGNGNGSTGNAVFVGLQTPTNGLVTGLGSFYSFKAGGGSNYNYTPAAGIGLLTMVFDTTDRQFVNGNEVPNYAAQVSGASVDCTSGTAVGHCNLGGSPAGSGFSGATFCTCKIYRASAYSGVLTPGEIKAYYAATVQAMQVRGLVTNMNSTGTNNLAIFAGDSITAGSGVTTPWPSQLVLGNGTWTILNDAVQNRTMTGFSKGATIENLPLFPPSPARKMELIWAGTNDIAVSGLTAAVTENAAESFNLQIKSQQGVPIAVGTMLSRTGFDTGKNSYDALLRQYWPIFANSLCDFASVAALGADGASASSTYFNVDGVHPKQTSTTNIIAPMAQACMDRLHGNRDESTATVYASAATAAVATTAVTESTNTVTVTMTTTPANCLAGNLAIITGVTPTGYNTTTANGYGLSAGNILTRSATQVTLYNPTTGLGNATIQGTLVCPQQQNNDVYSVVNFGAGNFTLQPAEFWMGEHVSIKNINAAPSVIVPFGSETVDGLSSITIASQQQITLQASLVSSAAGGANWVTLPHNSVLVTESNCSSSASPAVCGSATSGSVAIPTGTVSSTLTVNTTAVTANSQITFYPDDTLGTKLGVTCNNTLATLVGGSTITARTPGTSFQITFNGTIATNPVCGSFVIVN